LRARGGLTVWFTAEAIAGRRADARTGRDGQAKYSDLAIATALALRGVFRLALRQTEGLIASNLQLLGLDLTVPNHSTLSHRAETLEVPRLHCGREQVHRRTPRLRPRHFEHLGPTAQGTMVQHR
jgi:hypothetical protein